MLLLQLRFTKRPDSEQLENKTGIFCDYGDLSDDSLLTGGGEVYNKCGDIMDEFLRLFDTMRSGIEAAGFINVQEKMNRSSLGTWPRHEVHKDAGRLGMHAFKTGIEEWLLYMLTNFGSPEPWSSEQARVYFAMMKKELVSRPPWHIQQEV